MYTSPTPNDASASRCAVFSALLSSPDVADDAHAASTATRDGLDDHRQPELARDLEGLFLAVNRSIAAGQDRHPGLLHGAPRPGLVAEQADHVRRGPDEADVARLADFGEVGALGEESVSRVDRVGAGDLGGAEDRRHAQVAVGAAGRSDADVFVGKANVQRVLVGFGVDRDGLDAQFAAGIDDPQRNFTPVSDQNLLEHVP